MEQQQEVPRHHPHSPASHLMEYSLDDYSLSLSTTGMFPQTPPIINHHTTDQILESAFARIHLSQQQVRTPPFFHPPATVDYVGPSQSFPSPMSFSHNQFWAHRDIDVGPHANYHLNLVKNGQRRDLYDDHHGCSCLHCKKPFFEGPINQFYNSDANFCSPVSSSIHDNNRARMVFSDKDWTSGVFNLKLECLSVEQIEVVLSGVIENLSDLMTNHIRSRFVQRLFVVCNEDQRSRIIFALTRSPVVLINICVNSFGAMAMQKLLEKVVTAQQTSLVVSALSPGSTILACDPNGQHIIKYCVKHYPGEYNKHLFNDIAANCFKIATNKTGCCVLQSCVEYSCGEARERLLSQIIANAVDLSQNPYGNYVVQHILGMRIRQVTSDLVERFKGHFASLSCNKYASNVVEKFLLESHTKHSSTIIIELLLSPNADTLLLDPYGNFVIQAALSVSKGQVRAALLNLIRAKAHFMQSNLFGKKILAWLEKNKLPIA